ncbi:MAG: hypothetical protein HY525_01585 [Betaproteobacteria bacterium]|nr:hypothetical protein [Betaproteobacteria bacterium]
MTGLMMGMMEPPPEMEGEFHDWYDLEHLPSRAVVPGFLTAHRFVCIEGWPRYVAMYDLESLDVLSSPAYQAITGKNTSPWSRRVVGMAHGYFRTLGVQIYPGTALLGDQGPSARVLVLRFNSPADATIPDILEGLKALFEGRPETAQLRLFRSEFGGLYYIGMVELRRPIQISEIDITKFGRAGKCLDLINVYLPYFRRGATPPGSY